MHARFVRWTLVLAALASLFFALRAEGGGRGLGDVVADGATLFKNRSCAECHRLDGVGGGLGPDLSRVGDRLTREAIDALLARPRSVNPLAVMPNPALLPPEREELARFLAARSSSEVARHLEPGLRRGGQAGTETIAGSHPSAPRLDGM